VFGGGSPKSSEGEAKRIETSGSAKNLYMCAEDSDCGGAETQTPVGMEVVGICGACWRTHRPVMGRLQGTSLFSVALDCL
jgi:hypothetical protein